MDATRFEFAARHGWDRHFILLFCLIAWLAALGGFTPGFLQAWRGERSFPPFIVHVHALLFLGWLAIVTAQSLLARKPGLAVHRRLGYVGAAWAAAMVLVTVPMCLSLARTAMARGAAGDHDTLLVPLADMVCFPLLVGAALWRRRDAAAHQRLMLLATVMLLDGGLGRLVNPLIGDLFGGGPVGFFLRAYLMVDLLAVMMILYDLVSRGRAHPVIGRVMPLILLLQVAATLAFHQPGWPAMARRLVGF